MARVVVFHAGYGCDSGCCGHVIEIDGHHKGWTFSHPYRKTPEELRDWIRSVVIEEVGEAHATDIDFDHCVTSDD